MPELEQQLPGGRVLSVQNVLFAQDLRGPRDELDDLMVQHGDQQIEAALFSELRDSRVTDQGWRRG